MKSLKKFLLRFSVFVTFQAYSYYACPTVSMFITGWKNTSLPGVVSISSVHSKPSSVEDDGFKEDLLI